MAKGGRTYKRDGNGRFASTGGGGAKKAKKQSGGPSRLTRDNSGKITSVGGDGATARGGRLKTASGKLRETQIRKTSISANPKGAIRKSDVKKAISDNKFVDKTIRSEVMGTYVSREDRANAKMGMAKKRVAAQRMKRGKKYDSSGNPAKVKSGGVAKTGLRKIRAAQKRKALYATRAS